MDEIEQLLKEKWSDWKSSFSRTNGSFSASPVYQGADKREKCKDFAMEYPLERKGFRYGPGWKKWSVFFLWIKKSCNFNEFQYCLCVSSMWKFQSVMFQQIDFRTSCVFSHPGETRREKNWRSWKKFNYWPLSSENLTDLWFQLSRKIENTQHRWQPTYVKHKS